MTMMYTYKLYTLVNMTMMVQMLNVFEFHLNFEKLIVSQGNFHGEVS